MTAPVILGSVACVAIASLVLFCLCVISSRISQAGHD